MLISELLRHPTSDDNTHTTVTGVVRANYNDPFPHFTIQDQSGTIICQPKNTLPKAGIHIKITGILRTITPENCTMEITLFSETHRTKVPHPNGTCELSVCESARSLVA